MFLLLQLIVLFIIFLLACTGLYRAIRARPIKKIQALVSIAFIALFLLLLVHDHADSQLNLNPLIRGDAPLLGAWAMEGTTLQLHADGRYACAGKACNKLNSSGRWQRFQDFEIDFVPVDGAPVRWRVTENQGNYEMLSGIEVGVPSGRTAVAFRMPVRQL